jgi:hypothetical protein
MARPLSMTARAIKAREAIVRARSESRCIDCHAETSFTERGKNDEYYMVHNRLWLKANPGDAGKLCIGCLERRLGRQLKPNDFTDCSLNNFPRGSKRLISRLTGTPEQ